MLCVRQAISAIQASTKEETVSGTLETAFLYLNEFIAKESCNLINPTNHGFISHTNALAPKMAASASFSSENSSLILF